MKKYFKDIWLYVIIVIVFILGRCSASFKDIEIETVYLPQDTIRVHFTDTLIQVVREEIVKEIPIYYYIHDTITQAMVIDTMKIIAEFFTRKFYDQVFVDDSTGYIRLKQTVAMNNIEEQELIYVPPDKEIQYIIKQGDIRKLRFLVGTEYHINTDRNDISLKGGVLYKDKYNVNLGISLDNMKSIGINIIF